MQVVKIEGDKIENITRLVAKSVFSSGFFVQSFCLHNVGYVKFDKKPFASKQEEFSDFLLVMNSVQSLQETLKHAKEKSVVIVNVKDKPKSPIAVKRRLKIYNLDATQVALNTVRKPSLDAPMLGALVKVCDKITLKAAKSALGMEKELHMAVDEGIRSVK